MAFSKGLIDILVPIHQASNAAELIRDEKGWDEDELATYMADRGELDEDEDKDEKLIDIDEN